MTSPNIEKINDVCMGSLVNGLPEVMKSFQEDTGRFLRFDRNLEAHGWSITNQDLIYPLGVLYKSKHPNNPYHGERKILRAALLGGDCIQSFQYSDGKVEFLKVDGSKWGPSCIAWTMYHWLETYALFTREMGEGRAEEWGKGLTLAMEGMMKEHEKDPRKVHNIVAWKGMTLYRAGQIFEREDFKKTGVEMIYDNVRGQEPQGFWREHGGPTTHYNLMYAHPIGLYYEFSSDENVLNCIRRALDFQIKFTYPDGVPVETIDGRVKYSGHVSLLALSAFSIFPQGRSYVRFLLDNVARRNELSSCHPYFATGYLYIHSGNERDTLQDSRTYVAELDKMAIVRRLGKWFYCLSAITLKPKHESRWGMDRQNYISVWHEDGGLLLGGGNSKNQPDWSSFVVKDEQNISYVAHEGKIEKGRRGDTLRLRYGEVDCAVLPHVKNDQEIWLEYTAKASKEVAVRCNLTLHAEIGENLRTASGIERKIGKEKFKLTSKEIGGWVSFGRWLLEVPGKGELSWPVSPFNPYKKDGSAPLDLAKCILSTEFDSTERYIFKAKITE